MGKDWDKDKGGRDLWIKWTTRVAAQCLRVLKPGDHALVWALPRTSHWTATAWEDAGFEVRDRIEHIFESGFPKSMNISKQIDKMAGKEREVIGIGQGVGKQNPAWNGTDAGRKENALKPEYDITLPATPEAQQWDGWGTALKPSVEDWWLFRKPISEKTVAQNVLKWGTGAINIEKCRVSTTQEEYEKLNDGRQSNRTIRAGEVAKGFGMKPEGLKDTEQSVTGDGPRKLFTMEVMKL